MTRRAALAPPAARRFDQVMDDSAALARLGERLRESRAMLASVMPLLPGPLAGAVTPGPLDAEGWSLLAANAAVAAKLRQLVPHLEERLRDAGHAVATVRIKVLPR